jgi:hypothetical protein
MKRTSTTWFATTRGERMRKLIGLLTAAAPLAAVGVALVLPAAAGAGGPVDQFRSTFSYVDDDFCGTGQSVAGEGTITLTAWDLGGGVFKVTREFTQSLTNVATGAVIYNHVAGQTSNVTTDLGSGGETIEFVDTGTRSQIRVPGQGILLRDAGSRSESCTALTRTS